MLGIQEYYKIATRCNLDFTHIHFSLRKVMHNRLKKHITKTGKPSKFFIERYMNNNSENNKSSNFFNKKPKNKKYKNNNPKSNSKVKYLIGIPIFPLNKISFTIPKVFNQKCCPYTESGRKLIHTNLKENLKNELNTISTEINPDQSIEWNDLRISVWAAQQF